MSKGGTTFDSWLDWRLKHGSHDFPGPDGGTCINEAAVVVAGFEYREVASLTDLPESFCPVISQFCLTLNDAMPEGDILNRLRPFAIRLSGSADTRKVAQERARHLALKAAQAFATIGAETIDPAAVEKLRSADPMTALGILECLEEEALLDDDRAKSIGAARRAVEKALRGKDAIYIAELAAIAAIRAAAIDPRAWDAAIDVIESVLAIGKQANPMEVGIIDERAKSALAAVG